MGGTAARDRFPRQSIVTVRVVYLARLRDALGASGEELELPPAVGDVASLLGWLRARGGRWTAELAAGRAVRTAVNHEMASLETPVRDGDEVAFFPPVTGG